MNLGSLGYFVFARLHNRPRITQFAKKEADVVPCPKPGKDIWLFGGGVLFHSLLAAGLVDGIDVAVIPVLLGGGVPLLPTPAPRTTLTLKSQRVYEKSGIVGLEYDVVHAR